MTSPYENEGIFLYLAGDQVVQTAGMADENRKHPPGSGQRPTLMKFDHRKEQTHARELPSHWFAQPAYGENVGVVGNTRIRTLKK